MVVACPWVLEAVQEGAATRGLCVPLDQVQWGTRLPLRGPRAAIVQREAVAALCERAT